MSTSGKAQRPASADLSDIANKSIEELMNVDVTSVSRREQKLSKTPAAIYVITEQAIARSGANTIPDLLRMVPGVQVAQVEADRWAISVRGFNDIYSNKVLVLVDGRTVYTPSFSGVYWDQIDVPLDTVDRIEITRGPGGSVWGANAVNGVISIVTKDSRETRGASVAAGTGTAQAAGLEARYGGSIGGGFTYRTFGHYTSFGSLPTLAGISGNDAGQMRHAGFRADWNKSDKDAFMMEGDLFSTTGGQLILAEASASGTMPGSLRNSGVDALLRWTHRYSATWDSSFQVYEANYVRHDTGMVEKLNTVDFDYQNHVSLGAKNDLVFGGGYRNNADDITSPINTWGSLPLLGYTVAIVPSVKRYSLVNGFLQDQVKLTEDLSLTVGSKLEHNAFSGFEYEPTARLAWTPTAAQTMWLAASRAIRQPSRYDTGLDITLSPIPIASGIALDPEIHGNPNLAAEKLLDYEAGYRFTPVNRVLVDLAAFYSLYNDLEGTSIEAPAFTAGTNGLEIHLPGTVVNATGAHNYGSELAITWNVTPIWKLAGSYSWLRINLSEPSANSASVLQSLASSPLSANLPIAALSQAFQGATASNVVVGSAGTTTPRQQANIQSYFDVSRRITFDNSLYFVGGLPASGVPAYVRIDSRVGSKVRSGVDASIVGQNLLSPHHLEFGNVEQAIATEVNRGVFGKVVWTF